tara:strand:- start:237 stop:446 length:210 start_codon:yes stop_codon:yes gene_type:complete
MNRSRNNWYYEDPSELGKNWCLSVPYHDLKLIEETKDMAKKRNCKSVSQYIREVVRNDIRSFKKTMAHS